MASATEIDALAPAVEFSVCTLVTRHSEYEEMLASFLRGGFREPGTEFIYTDNTEGNKYDAYQSLSQFLSLARGRYIIVCHQDVRLHEDGIAKLLACIDEIKIIDEHWAILGNAGGVSLDRVALRITDPWIENARVGRFPELVTSLDENFVVIRRSANLGVSHDLSGFHLYGTDLCLMADIQGCSSYVVDFHLQHLGGGSDQGFAESRQSLLNKYQHALRPRFVRSTCTRMYLSGSRLGQYLFNRSWVYKVARFWIRLLSRR